jgi:flavin reductase (DIM6/NTAB) family NADH-FMN oxidoreductase RutF
MQVIDPATLGPRAAYRLLASIVIPRPIAWVGSVSTAGVVNLAPFSFYNLVAGDPPTVMVSVGRRGALPKDTLRNVQDVPGFTLSVVDESLAAVMNQTSADVGPEVDEFALAGLTRASSRLVAAPFVAEAAIALEARVVQLVPVPDASYTMVLGRIVQIHLRPGVLRADDGLVDAARLRPLARLGGDDYAGLGAIVTLRRPGG